MASKDLDQTLLAKARTLSNTPWCADYEKMVSGMLYSCLAPELVHGRFRARRLCHAYNTYFPPDATAESLDHDRFAMLKKLLGTIGNDAFIEPPFRVDYGCNIIVGDRFYANFNLTILDCSLVIIGNRVMIGPNVSIFGATHETEVQSRREYIEYARPVTIGDDCWIGGQVCIMPGVTVGRGTTIAAGSVVTKDIPEFSVAMGVPAKVVKKVTAVEPLPEDGERNANPSAAGTFQEV